MDKPVLINFLRHLLFLLVLLKIVNCILSIFYSSDTVALFDKHDLIPMTMNITRKTMEMIIETFQVSFEVFQLAGLVVNVMAIYGIVKLFRHSIVIFAVGKFYLLLFPIEFIFSAFIRPTLLKFFDSEIQGAFEEIFNRSREINMTVLKSLNLEANSRAAFNAPVVDGWSILTVGSKADHAQVDFIQMTYKCCGYGGRHNWLTRIPSSCCPEKYPGNECILDYANDIACNKYYNEFHSSFTWNIVDGIFFSLITLAAAASALTLAHFRLKYPNEDYGSDSSSESDEE